MGKEAKIGLTVIGILLVVFCGVLANRLIGAKPEGEQAESTNVDKDESPDKTPKASASDKPTIIAAKASSGEVPSRSTASKPSRWATASDSNTAKSSTARTTGGSSRPSYMPKPASSAVSRYGSGSRLSSTNTWQQTPSTSTVPMPPKPGSASHGTNTTGSASQMPDGSGQQPAGASVASNPLRGQAGYGTSQSSPYARSTTVQRQVSPYSSGTSPSYRSTPSNTASVRGQTVSNPGGGYSALDQSSQYGASAGSSTYTPTSVGRNDDGTYTVQPNDSYWTISQQLYGSGRFFKALSQFNRGKHPQADQLRVGDKILAPTEAELREALADLCPSQSHGESDKQRVSTAGLSGGYAGGRVYVVEDGDTLYDIARYELGKSARWVEIYQLNRTSLGTDFDYLTPGTRLVLPDDGRSVENVTQRPAPSYNR